MKRKGLVAFSVILCLLAAFPSFAAPKATRLVIGSGPIGGAFYPIAGGIAAIINKYVPEVNVSVQVTGGGIENTRLVGTGEIDLGLSSMEQAYSANAKVSMFAKDNLSLTALGTLHPSVQQIIALKKSGITEVEHLKGKKVSVGEPGGGAEVAFKQMIAALGWKTTDVQMVFLPYEQSMDQLGDGLLDAACVYAGVPAPTVSALATKNKVVMVNCSEDAIKKLKAAGTLFSFEKFPAGTYNGMDSDIVTQVQRILLVVRDKFDPDLSYKITKAVYEHLDELATYHAAAKSITRNTASDVLITLNSGAEKYYKESGLLK